LSVRFPDNEKIQVALEKEFLAEETRTRQNDPPPWPGAGGVKVREIIEWENPALKLLNERAKLLYKKILNAKTAHIDDTWANLYRLGEFIGPHAHRRTEASVVYHLIPPSPEQQEDYGMYSGALGVCDPRIGRCCPMEKGHVTTQLYLPMLPGTMVIFPSFATHHVTPHASDDVRISIAWNIDREKIPGQAKDDAIIV